MTRRRPPSLDVQIGLDFNRAVMNGNGDAAAAAFAEIVRAQKLVISKEAWNFLGDAVRDQGGDGSDAANGDVKEPSTES